MRCAPLTSVRVGPLAGMVVLLTSASRDMLHDSGMKSHSQSPTRRGARQPILVQMLAAACRLDGPALLTVFLMAAILGTGAR